MGATPPAEQVKSHESHINRTSEEQSMQTQTDNTAIVAEMYQALGRGDIETIIDAVSDDVDWSTDAALAEMG